MPFSRQKKLEFQASSLGSRAVKVLLSDDYCQRKANRTAHAFSQYPQQNAEEKAIFQAKNTKILSRLQSSLAKVLGLIMDNFSLLY